MASSEKHSGDVNQSSHNSLSHKLSHNTPFLGLKLKVVIAICVVCFIAVFILGLACFCWNRKLRKRRMRIKHTSGSIPTFSGEITKIKKASNGAENDKIAGETKDKKEKEKEEKCYSFVDAVKEINIGNGSGGSNLSGDSHNSSSAVSVEVPNLGWGQCYSLEELEKATNGFAKENVIGEGGYGIVYRGELQDRSTVAVKSLMNKKGQAEKEFKVEVEAIGKVRHRYLVGLIGYCAEGAQRMLVYEYVENGNLEQWLHADVGPVSPLTWDVRMKIAVGTAKGLAYLHEGLEPKVVHRDVKSSNILLDKKWSPKVSDFGLAKLLGSDASYVTTRVMGTFGCVAPEYASTGMLSECSDVYSFGVLLMEIISGRCPVDYSRPVGEVNLVDWFKGMVGSKRGEEVLDPLIEAHPSPRALKRALLVCLRCTDLDANKRPKIGQVAHMLEGDDFPFRADKTCSSLHMGTAIANKIQFPSKIVGLR